jgi:hypothetical protein
MIEAPQKIRRRRGEWAAARAAAALLIGRAFRCSDGLVRWITGLSTRDYFSLLWLDERTNTWFSGGIIKIHKWQELYGDAEEVRGPQPGERYQLAGPTGMVDERTVIGQS